MSNPKWSLKVNTIFLDWVGQTELFVLPGQEPLKVSVLTQWMNQGESKEDWIHWKTVEAYIKQYSGEIRAHVDDQRKSQSQLHQGGMTQTPVNLERDNQLLREDAVLSNHAHNITHHQDKTRTQASIPPNSKAAHLVSQHTGLLNEQSQGSRAKHPASSTHAHPSAPDRPAYSAGGWTPVNIPNSAASHSEQGFSHASSSSTMQPHLHGKGSLHASSSFENHASIEGTSAHAKAVHLNNTSPPLATSSSQPGTSGTSSSKPNPQPQSESKLGPLYLNPPDLEYPDTGPPSMFQRQNTLSISLHEHTIPPESIYQNTLKPMPKTLQPRPEGNDGRPQPKEPRMDDPFYKNQSKKRRIR